MTDAPAGWHHVISPRSGKILTTYRANNYMLGWYQKNGYIIW